MSSLAVDNSAVGTAQGPMEDSREASSSDPSVCSLANLTEDQLIDLQKQEYKAKRDTPEARRKKFIDKFVKKLIKNIAQHEKKHIPTEGLRNLLAMWMLCGQMGSSTEMSDLLREKFLYFHDNRTAWLYFVLKGKIVLDEFSAIAKLPEDILIHLLPFLCGDRRDDFPKSIMAMDLFNVLPNVSGKTKSQLANSAHWLPERLIATPLIEPLVIFQLGNSIFCFDTVDDTFQRIALPNRRRTIPRKLVEDPTKETTVLSFFQKGRTVINESLKRFSSLSHVRALVYFFVFATIKNRDTGGVCLNSRFKGIAKSFANRPHTLYWILLCQELLDSVRVSVRVHSDAWSNRLMERVDDNIKRVKAFDPTSKDYGAQVRCEGYIIGKVEFPVHNHPSRQTPVVNVRFGIKLLPNDLLVAAPLTYGDMISEWLRQFWNHPISLLFQHNIPKPNADGLPPLSLYNKWYINKYVNSIKLSLHRHREHVLELPLQGRGTKFTCAFLVKEQPITAELCFYEMWSGRYTYKSMPYDTNLWEYLEGLYGSVHKNELEFIFEPSIDGEPFELTKQSTIADLALRRNLKITVPFIRVIRVTNTIPYQRPYCDSPEEYRLNYNEKLLAWLDKTFPHLKEFKVFCKIQFEKGFKAREDSTVGEFVNYVTAGKNCQRKVEITLPKIFYLKVVNSICFRDYDEYLTENLPYECLLDDVVDSVLKRNPFLVKEDLQFFYKTDPYGDIYPFYYKETSTIRDLVRSAVTPPELRCKKILQRVPEKAVVSEEVYDSFVRTSAFRLAQLIEKKMDGCLQSLSVLRDLTANKTVLREYIFFKQTAPTASLVHLEYLLSLLYLFLFKHPQRCTWSRDKVCYFVRLKQSERKTPTISIAEVNSDKRKRFLEMAAVGPEESDLKKAKDCLRFLQMWQSEGTTEEQKIVNDFVDCIPLKLCKLFDDSNDCLDSVFEVVLKEMAHKDSSYRCDCYSQIEFDRNGDGEESWGSRTRNRPFVQYVPYTIPCFELYGGLVPVNRDLSRWLETAYFLSSLHGRKKFRSEPDQHGLMFHIESCLDSPIDKKSPFEMMGRHLSEEEEINRTFYWYRRKRYKALKEADFRFKKGTTKYVDFYFVWTTAKGKEKRLSYEVGHRYLSAKSKSLHRTLVECDSRDPTVSKPWQSYRFLKDDKFYTIANEYSEPVEDFPTEKQKQILLKRAKKNMLKTTETTETTEAVAKKRKSSNSTTRSGLKKKKKAMTEAERKILVKRIAAKYNVSDEEELKKFEEFKV